MIACEQVDLDYVLFNDPLAGKDDVDSTSKIVVIADTPAKEKSEKTSKSDGGISMKKISWIIRM